jgi:hypothetical protein
MQEVAARRKEERLRVGRRSRDRLQAITIALLMDQRGWTQKQVADHFGWNDETTVSKWVKDGRDILGGR